MATNILTDAACKKAAPGPKLVKLFDGHGLHLAILPSGAKVWRCAYRINKKPQTISFGPYPAVTLAKAREKRDELLATLRDGGDPMAPRKAKRGGLTFKEACEQYWAGRKDVTEGYRGNALRALEMHLMPKLGALPIGAIDRAALLAELDRMDAAGLHVYVRKTRMWVGQVFEWAVERGDAQINPAALINPAKAFGRSKVEHFAALELTEIPAFMERLAMEREITSALALRMLAYTWVRTKELRFMQWGQIEGDLWRIPAEVMKREKDHLVPLSTQAVDILKRMKARSRGGDYVFHAEHRTDRTISENAVLYLLHRMGYKGRMTGHGFRSVASTWANEAGYRADAIERQLSHVPDDKVRAAYNRAEHMPERRAMLQAWADWLSGHVDASSAKG